MFLTILMEWASSSRFSERDLRDYLQFLNFLGTFACKHSEFFQVKEVVVVSVGS